MRISVLIPLVIGTALAQFAWASHWGIAGVFPNLVLVVLVVITLLAGQKSGLIGALVAGITMFLVAPFPLGGQALALLAAVAAAGILAEFVFTSATPVTVFFQAGAATAVFGIVNLAGTNLIFWLQGMNAEQLWSVELGRTLGQMIYHLVLIFALYNLVIFFQRWWQQNFRGWRWRKRVIL